MIHLSYILRDKPTKNNMIGSLLYFFIKMSLLGFVSTFIIDPQTNLKKHSLFTSHVFYIDGSQNTKQLNDTFVLYSPL